MLIRTLTKDETINKNITNTTNADNNIDEHYHVHNIYLLVIDLVIFVVFTYLSQQSYKKYSSKNDIKSNENETTEEKETNSFRVIFIKGLVLSNGGI
jgi:hypothetical protein